MGGEKKGFDFLLIVNTKSKFENKVFFRKYLGSKGTF